jgi:ribosomal protein S18 acetylase RimI-like enzyme
VKIRSGILADVPSMIAIERASSTAAHWSEQQYLELFQPTHAGSERLVLVADLPSPDPPSPDLPSEDSPSANRARDTVPAVGAFLVARHIAAEWELENIVVAPTTRRKGLGLKLLEALLIAAKQSDSEAVFLEVRESNTAARALYERFGLYLAGRRKSYYANPLEDALQYRRDLF